MLDGLLQRVPLWAEMPLFQGLGIALATFVLEDPATVLSGLLVADGRLNPAVAWLALTAGIAVGDVLLYALGRVAGARVVRWGLLEPARLDRAKSWFERNLLLAVVASRFLPGTRLPTYVGAGVLRASAGRFVAVCVAASAAWTTLLLAATVQLGEAILPLFGRYEWPAVLLLVGLLALVQRGLFRSPAAPKGVVSRFEFWPPVLFYVPVALYYVWLALRYRGLTLPTVANPSIYSGGMVMESKSQILSLVPPGCAAWVARHAVFLRPAKTHSLDHAVLDALRTIDDAGLAFPFVAKPDIGQRGAGVRLLSDRDALRDYVEAFPEGTRILLQEYAGYPNEAGVLYCRLPDETQGRLFSITLKQFPSVRGDGRRTLRELIEADPRARLIRDVYFRRHRAALDRVLAEGNVYPLVFAGNHAQGAIFKNGCHLATPELLARIDAIARALPEFYFGRFDIRFENEGSFARGERFRIVEINGAGAEATHIWDARTTLREAYATLFEQFRILFRIGARNRARGFAPLTPLRLLRDFQAYLRLANQYPTAH